MLRLRSAQDAQTAAPRYLVDPVASACSFLCAYESTVNFLIRTLNSHAAGASSAAARGVVVPRAIRLINF
jgi:hypothetical protein